MRINSAKYKLEYFYANHPDLRFFKEIWDISDEFLSQVYGEFKYVSDATFLMGNGLYIYNWKYLDINKLEISNDDNYYYIKIPADILPVFDKISFVRGKLSFTLNIAGDVAVVDYEDWFAIRLVKGFFSVDTNVYTSYNTITYNDIIYEGIWIPEYSDGVNYIENYFGNIFGVFINRDLYKTLGNSNGFPAEYSIPSDRVLAVNSRYASMIEDIVKTIMGYKSVEYFAAGDVIAGTQYINSDRVIDGSYSSVKIVNKDEVFGIDYTVAETADVTGTVIDIEDMAGDNYKIKYRLGSGLIEYQIVDAEYILSIKVGDEVYSGNSITNGRKILQTEVNISETHEILKIESSKIYLKDIMTLSFSPGSSLFLYDESGSRGIKGHPSPANIKFVIDSILKNYIFNDDGSSVVDRVNSSDLWYSPDTFNMFVAKLKIPISSISKDTFDVLFKILSYFKPIFTTGVISADDNFPKKDGVKMSDSLFMNNKTIEIPESYLTFSLVAPTMRGRKKLKNLTNISSIKDSVSYSYIKELNIGDVNEHKSE